MKKLIERIISQLFYSGLTKEDYNKVVDQIEQSNRQTVILWSAGTGLFWIMSIMLSLKQEAYALCLHVYYTALAMCLIVWVCAVFFIKKDKKAIFVIRYLYELSLIGAGVGIALCQPDVRTVTFIVTAVIVSVCFIKHTITTVIIHLLTIIAYILFGRNVIQPDIFTWGLTNLVIFSVAGLFLGHTINKLRFERFFYADSIEQFAKLQERYAYYDQLSGVKNRRAFEESLKNLSENKPKELCIVLADLNGLKSANDNFGHEAGDELVVGASECISQAFNGIDTIYRIGGDEFCVIINESIEKATQCLKTMEEITAKWRGTYSDELSISYGVGSIHDAEDIGDIVKIADKRMYEFKRNYYAKTGKDRRQYQKN